MPQHHASEPVDEQLQALDVHIVDVLAHLEALLRDSHSIQRALLKLRAEASPPAPVRPESIWGVLNGHAHQMRRDCEMLAGIVDDLTIGIKALTAQNRDVVMP